MSQHPVSAAIDSTSLPDLVSDCYREAPPTLRAKLLEVMLRPLSPLALAAVAAGAFGGFLHRLSQPSPRVSLDDVAGISAGHMLELARFVEQCAPEAFMQIGNVLTENPAGITTLSASLLLLALRRWTNARG